MGTTTRRSFIAAATALPLFSIVSSRASAAEFRLKFATGQDPSHPVNKRAQEAIDRIKSATEGRVEINLFPAPTRLRLLPHQSAALRRGRLSQRRRRCARDVYSPRGHRQHGLRFSFLRCRVRCKNTVASLTAFGIPTSSSPPVAPLRGCSRTSRRSLPGNSTRLPMTSVTAKGMQFLEVDNPHSAPTGGHDGAFAVVARRSSSLLMSTQSPPRHWSSVSGDCPCSHCLARGSWVRAHPR